MSSTTTEGTTPESEIVVHGSVLASNRVSDGQSHWVIRMILPPGAETPHWTRLGATTMYVESGLLQFTGVTGNGLLTRDIHPVERGLSTTGVPIQLQPGDTVTVNRGIQHSLFNPVDRPTSIIVTTISPSDVVPYDGLRTAEGYPIVIES